MRVEFNECLDFLSAANEEKQQPSYGMNALTSPGSSHDICPVHPEDGSRSSLTKRNNLFIQLPETHEFTNNANPISADEAYNLFHLVPQPTTPVGLMVPTADELDAYSRPVPQQLLEAQVEWHRYGFYSAYGN